MKPYYFKIIIVIFLILVWESCARRGRPTGGPKDEDAPIMLMAEPTLESLNFKSKTISISFDEYIKLRDVGRQLIVSPPLKYKPIITPLGTASKTLKIELLDTLIPETTYIFNFGTSVQDNNEGNVLYNFKYIMSTGNYIDSLKIKGIIKDAISNKVDKDVAILLYRIDENFNDSIVYNGQPNYIANTLDTVAWEITNIKQGKYLLAALKQKNYDYKFKPKSDKIAFYPHIISIPNDSIFDINLFKEILDYKLTRPSEVSKRHIVFGYEGIAKDLKISLLSEVSPDFKSIHAYEIDKDTLNYWFSESDLDSLQFKVTHKSFVDTVTVRLRAKQFDSLIVGSRMRGALNLKQDFKILTNQPIINIDTAKVILMDKDSVRVAFTTEISKYKTELIFKFDKEPSNRYNLTLLPEAITTFFEKTKDTINYRFSTRKIIDYGGIFLSFKGVRSYPIIVQLVDNGGNVIRTKYLEKSQEISFTSLNPSKYLLRAIYDTNKNERWDTGNYLNKIQPEQVIYFPKEIDVRANWEITEVFDLSN